ncbi:hypothetical protein AINA4_11970 [Aurantimicrobium sp. INA4]|nr:hypothetical protein AINA4_11970 [Aurantimicrobium sp. INA4]
MRNRSPFTAISWAIPTEEYAINLDDFGPNTTRLINTKQSGRSHNIAVGICSTPPGEDKSEEVLIKLGIVITRPKAIVMTIGKPQVNRTDKSDTKMVFLCRTTTMAMNARIKITVGVHVAMISRDDRNKTPRTTAGCSSWN